MHLVAKGFDMALHGEFFFKALHSLGILVLGREHAEGDFDALGVFGVDHGGVDFGDGGEGGAGLGG